MDFTNFSLDNLKFELKRKQEELLNETIEVFTYNPNIPILAKEIQELQIEIDKREGK